MVENFIEFSLLEKETNLFKRNSRRIKTEKININSVKLLGGLNRYLSSDKNYVGVLIMTNYKFRNLSIAMSTGYQLKVVAHSSKESKKRPSLDDIIAKLDIPKFLVSEGKSAQLTVTSVKKKSVVFQSEKTDTSCRGKFNDGHFVGKCRVCFGYPTTGFRASKKYGIVMIFSDWLANKVVDFMYKNIKSVILEYMKDIKKSSKNIQEFHKDKTGKKYIKARLRFVKAESGLKSSVVLFLNRAKDANEREKILPDLMKFLKFHLDTHINDMRDQSKWITNNQKKPNPALEAMLSTLPPLLYALDGVKTLFALRKVLSESDVIHEWTTGPIHIRFMALLRDCLWTIKDLPEEVAQKEKNPGFRSKSAQSAQIDLFEAINNITTIPESGFDLDEEGPFFNKAEKKKDISPEADLKAKKKQEQKLRNELGGSLKEEKKRLDKELKKLAEDKEALVEDLVEAKEQLEEAKKKLSELKLKFPDQAESIRKKDEEIKLARQKEAEEQDNFEGRGIGSHGPKHTFTMPASVGRKKIKRLEKGETHSPEDEILMAGRQLKEMQKRVTDLENYLKPEATNAIKQRNRTNELKAVVRKIKDQRSALESVTARIEALGKQLSGNQIKNTDRREESETDSSEDSGEDSSEDFAEPEMVVKDIFARHNPEY